jgi:diguanylate cyclase (GGDEF)-like protein
MQMQDEPHPLRVTPQFVALPPDDAVTGGGCGILVVEDSPMMVRKLVEIASASGRTVYSAADAAEALKLFVEHRPGVVVSDWEMPGDSGVDLCRQIRGQSIGRHAHFIMLTSHSDHEAILQAYNAGVDDFVAKPFDPDELLARIHAGERIHQLHEDLTRKTSEQQSLNSELAAMNVKLDRLAVTDDLTGLFNRRYAVARLEEHWALAERYNQPVTLGMVDLDKFKNVNDTYGHPAGDVVLRQVARMLRQTLRSTDIVCRIGGEEFMILFAAQTVEEAAISAERCRRAVASQSIRAAGVAISVTISIGLAGRTTEMAEYSDLMHAADRMLYDAKRNGRNRVEVAGRAEEGGADNLNTVFRYVAESAGPLRPAALRAGAGLNRASVLSRCGGDERFADAVTEQFRTEAPLCAERIAAALKSADAQSLRCAAQKLGSLAAYVSADRVTDYSRRVEHLAETNGLLEAGALLPRLKREIDGIVVTLEANAGAIMAICA